MKRWAQAAVMLLGAGLVSQALAAERVLVTIDARIGTEARGRARGEQAARADLAAGIWKLYDSAGPETSGDPARRAVRERLLRERGIRLELGPGCTEPGEQRGFAAAYNETLTAEARRRFGPDFWAQLDRDVDRQLQARPSTAVRPQGH